jgi:hypothetical protein
MLNKLTGFSLAGDFRLNVAFADGASGVFDAGPSLKAGGSLGRQTLDPEIFPRVFLEFGALTWPNGYDICPDWLRMEMLRAGSLMSHEAAE